MKLYELPEAYRDWEAAVDAAGEVTDELAAEIDRLDATLAGKVDAICKLVDECEADEAAYRERARSFQQKAQGAAGRSAALKAYLMHVLRAMEVAGVKGRAFSAAIVKSGTPTIRWRHGGEIPDGFRVVDVHLDAARALEAYRAGTLPPGFDVQFSEHLRIR